MKRIRLTETDIENVNGGRFVYDVDYSFRMSEAVLTCPACHTEGSLEFCYRGWDGYSDGRAVAVEDRICNVCHKQIALFPESNTMAIVTNGDYGSERYPYKW